MSGEFTIKQLAETIIEMVGGNSELIFEPLPQDDPKQRQPDISLAKKILDWEPKIKLENGLEKTIEHFSKILLQWLFFLIEEMLDQSLFHKFYF